jgi:tight adherence protein B
VSLGVVLAVAAGAAAAWLVTPTGRFVERHTRAAPAVPALTVIGLLVMVPHSWTVPAALLACAALGGRTLWRGRTAARQAEAHAARMAEVCDLLAAELSAGRPPDAALLEAAGVWPLMAPVAQASRLGGDVPAALRSAAETRGAEGLRYLAAAWTVSHRTGGGLGVATRRVAEAVRRQQATRSVVVGELASARATARLVAVLPVLALLMGSGAGADPWSFLLRTPPGWACLASGLAVGFAGLWWIELIARDAET